MKPEKTVNELFPEIKPLKVKNSLERAAAMLLSVAVVSRKTSTSEKHSGDMDI